MKEFVQEVVRAPSGSEGQRRDGPERISRDEWIAKIRGMGPVVLNMRHAQTVVTALGLRWIDLLESSYWDKTICDLFPNTSALMKSVKTYGEYRPFFDEYRLRNVTFHDMANALGKNEQTVIQYVRNNRGIAQAFGMRITTRALPTVAEISKRKATTPSSINPPEYDEIEAVETASLSRAQRYIKIVAAELQKTVLDLLEAMYIDDSICDLIAGGPKFRSAYVSYREGLLRHSGQSVTQADLAKAIGVSTGALYAYSKKVPNLFAAFNVTVTDLRSPKGRAVLHNIGSKLGNDEDDHSAEASVPIDYRAEYTKAVEVAIDRIRTSRLTPQAKMISPALIHEHLPRNLRNRIKVAGIDGFLKLNPDFVSDILARKLNT